MSNISVNNKDIRSRAFFNMELGDFFYYENKLHICIYKYGDIDRPKALCIETKEYTMIDDDEAVIPVQDVKIDTLC